MRSPRSRRTRPAAQCRRAVLLRHFRDPHPPAPAGRCCDVCEPPGDLAAGGIDVTALRAAVLAAASAARPPVGRDRPRPDPARPRPHARSLRRRAGLRQRRRASGAQPCCRRSTPSSPTARSSPAAAPARCCDRPARAPDGRERRTPRPSTPTCRRVCATGDASARAPTACRPTSWRRTPASTRSVAGCRSDAERARGGARHGARARRALRRRPAASSCARAWGPSRAPLPV